MRNRYVWGILMAGTGWCQMLDLSHNRSWDHQSPAALGRDEDLLLEFRLRSWERQQELLSVSPSERPTGESVSVARLQHRVPKQARKLFLAAEKLSRDGEHGKAAEQLDAVVLEDPNFAGAYILRGVEYVRLSRFEEARQSLERAVELDSYAWEAHYDLALVLYQLGDLRGAEMRAYRALDLSRTNRLVHVFLGYLLCLRAETRAAGLEHVKYAARMDPELRHIENYCPEPAP